MRASSVNRVPLGTPQPVLEPPPGRTVASVSDHSQSLALLRCLKTFKIQGICLLYVHIHYKMFAIMYSYEANCWKFLELNRDGIPFIMMKSE